MEDNQTTILKELSDIKSSLAVNTSETANIKQSMQEIKIDIKEIKNDYISRRELNETIVILREEIKKGLQIAEEKNKPVRNGFYWTLAIFGAAIIGAIIKLILVK